MDHRLKTIVEHITALDYIKITKPFEETGWVINGSVELSVEDVKLPFDVEIKHLYPRQFHDTETIRFINNDLGSYDHVNHDGSICVHTLHSPDLKRKIEFDFNSLKQWVIRYYINKEKDPHYEHIIVPEQVYEGKKSIFLFTNVDHEFTTGQFGFFSYSQLSSNISEKAETITNLVQDFKVNKANIECTWSKMYKPLERQLGLFYFIENPPVINRRFAISNWLDFEPHASQEFLQFMYNLSKSLRGKKNIPSTIPLLIGYKVAEIEIHWQVILIPTDNFPNYGYHVKELNKWIGKLNDQEIIWAATQNCSYHYYFGRGILHEKLSQAKILVIGIGAIGSMLATTLTRGGCTDLTLIDHDIKNPENVCRSEYSFFRGVIRKTEELCQTLALISPFINARGSEEFIDLAKLIFDNPNGLKAVKNYFSGYDIIFDCTTDNDVIHILDQLDIPGEVYTLSITNHAKELVCATKPNIYNWTMEIFETLNNDTEDLYKPTGCWSPTFKASYNDIAVLVQFAIKHINSCLLHGTKSRNFYLSSTFEDGFNIKLNQF